MVNNPAMHEIRNVRLSQVALTAIGRIVRVCADLEDLVNLWICKLAGTPESTTSVLLGRSNISTKINIAEGLANLSSAESLRLHKRIFDDGITKLLACRNATAHGVLIGRTKAGVWMFNTATTVGYEGDTLHRRADGYKTNPLKGIASVCEERVRVIPNLLGLGPLRDKREWQHLPDYQPGQQKQKSSAKPKHRP